MHCKKLVLFLSAFVLVGGSFISAASAEDAPDAWDEVLAAAGLTKATARFDFLDMGNYGGNQFLLPFFDAMHREPLRIPFYARVFKSDLLAAAPLAGELAMSAGWRIDAGPRRTLIGDPLEAIEKQAAAPDALLSAITKIHETASTPLTAQQKTKLAASLQTVPPDIARNAALLLYAELHALRWRNRALKSYDGPALQRLFAQLTADDAGDDETWSDEQSRLMREMDLNYLMVGGIDLSLAVDKAAEALEKRVAAETFSFDWDTPLGRIALHGAGDDIYAAQPFLLIIDAGGNDRYFGGGATSGAANPVSVALDLAGDDQYLEQKTLEVTSIAEWPDRKTAGGAPKFGAGVLGYGILVDAGGNDLYRSRSDTQGRGLFGLGILQDRGGNDRYDCYTAGQGAAFFGVGALADLGGNDEYRCFTTSQGFGGTKGCGVLIDAGAGNDLYDANDAVIDFPSPQDPRHNATLAQGAGYGRRADYTDNHSLAGGIGGLVDEGGANSFSCGVYGQGTGYWYGLGLLCAGEGNDMYRGVWYVQGAEAHFAVGVLWDAGGDDDYKATHNMAQGAGHDFGTGFLIDDAGNDRHEAPNLSLGGGNDNGFGFFWDKAGNDTYLAGAGTSFGRGSYSNRAFSIRDRNLTLGVFLDGGGEDSYPAKLAHLKNNVLWTQAETSKPPFVRGAGLDVATEKK